MNPNQLKAAALSLERRKRINRLKKMILTVVSASILLLLVVCGFLLFHVFSAQKTIKDLKKENQKLQEENQLLAVHIDDKAMVKEPAGGDSIAAEPGEQTEQNEPAGDATQAGQPGENQAEAAPAEEVKKVYLTFDDGPSENTGPILDILKQYNIKATFFVIGKTDQTSQDLYRRIVAEGHSLGIHTYSHRYTEVYASMDSFKNDILSLQALLKEATGKDVYLYRFPGGSSNSVSKVPISDCIRFLNENGFTYFDWNVTNGDATGKKLSSEEMTACVMNDVPKVRNATILMHDGPGKQMTVTSLPMIIEQLQASGVTFAALDENAVPVQHVKADSVQ